MKDLLVMRHGKSSWDEPHLADRDRPLSKRGRRDVPEMGRRLRGRGVAPQCIVTSGAVRARDTAGLLADALGLGADVVAIEERLYSADAEAVRGIVAELPDDFACVALVGHNPAFHAFLQRVSDLGIAKFPTAAVASLRFPVARWRDVATRSAEVLDYDFPKSGRD